jgi:DNA-binding MarR family transcriptional regulator
MDWRNKSFKVLSLTDTETAILNILNVPKNVQKIAEDSGISRTGVNHVLKNLVSKGLIKYSPVGKRRTYSSITLEELSQKFQQTLEEIEIANKDKKGAKIKISKEDEFIIHIGAKEIIPAYRRIAAEKMDIYVMGGAVAYKRSPDWVEYNIKIDVPSAKQVIESGLPIKYIMAQTTHNPVYEVTIDHPWYKQLESSTEPGHKLLYEHCKLWFTKRGHGTSMHDPLTVLAALGYSFTAFTTARVILDDAGVIQLDDNGKEITYSVPESQAGECMDFIGTILI